MTDQIPTQIPPSAGGASTEMQAGAAPLFAAGGEHAASAAAGALAAADPASLAASAAPAHPAEADAQAAAAVLATTWQYNKKVTALWSINQSCNSWAGIEGLGWRKLFSGIETSTIALTIIAASARATQGLVSFREESDGMVHEIYAF
jgi:hypothetical protein